jgi:hypothetical protein
MPSRKRSPRATKPRMIGPSPCWAPSPALNVMPGIYCQRLLDGRGVLLLDDRLRDHVDRLRHVEEWHGQARDAGIGDLVGRRAQRRTGATRPRLCRRVDGLGGWRRWRERPGGRGLHRGWRARSRRMHRYRRQRHVRFLLSRRRRIGWRLLRGRLLVGGRLRLGLHRVAEIEQRRRGHEAGFGSDGPLNLPPRCPRHRPRSFAYYFRTTQYYA